MGMYLSKIVRFATRAPHERCLEWGKRRARSRAVARGSIQKLTRRVQWESMLGKKVSSSRAGRVLRRALTLCAQVRGSQEAALRHHLSTWH